MGLWAPTPYERVGPTPCVRGWCAPSVFFMGCVIFTSHYPTSILHQDILGVRLMYMGPTYMRLICMGPTPYVFFCMIDVR
jgi:hypothetical protein